MTGFVQRFHTGVLDTKKAFQVLTEAMDKDKEINGDEADNPYRNPYLHALLDATMKNAPKIHELKDILQF
jgi:hypothetical protein